MREMMDIVIIDQWSVVDRWWTISPIRTYYRVVSFMGRNIVFKRTFDDSVWRIVGYDHE